MDRIIILILVLVGIVAVIVGRAALDTALAAPRIAAEAEERSAW